MCLTLLYSQKKYFIPRHLNPNLLNPSSIIAIDGFASTGKSTLAKRLSQHYKIPFIDSGAMYRGITLFAIEKKILKGDDLDRKGLGFALEGIKMKFDFNSGDLFLNGENIAKKIRLPLVSDHVCSIAALSFIRDFLLKQLRQMGQESGLVMDGRDIGTVVFPEADYKFFFNAQPEVRAQRRFEELKAQGQKITFDAVLKNLIQRDALDSDRDVAPLRKAYDAIEIDTSERTTDEVFAFLLQKIEAK